MFNELFIKSLVLSHAEVVTKISSSRTQRRHFSGMHFRLFGWNIKNYKEKLWCILLRRMTMESTMVNMFH